MQMLTSLNIIRRFYSLVIVQEIQFIPKAHPLWERTLSGNPIFWRWTEHNISPSKVFKLEFSNTNIQGTREYSLEFKVSIPNLYLFLWNKFLNKTANKSTRFWFCKTEGSIFFLPL